MKKTLIVLLGLVISFGFAQDKKAEKIFNQYVEAIGGKAKMEKVQSILKKFTAKQMGQEIPMEMYASRKGEMYQKMSMMGMEMVVMAIKDGKGFVLNQQMGYDDLDEEKLKEFTQNISLFDMAEKYDNMKLEYVGQKEKDGKKYEVIKAVSDKGDESFLYFDSGTHLLRYVIVKSDQGEVETELSDYKEIDGIKIPMKTTVRMGGQVVSEITTTEVIFNPGKDQIDENAFVKPE